MSNNNVDIEWAEPPNARGGGGRRVVSQPAVLDALRARPNTWACVRRSHPNASVLTSFVRRNADFEGTTRLNPDGTFDLFMRYVEP